VPVLASKSANAAVQTGVSASRRSAVFSWLTSMTYRALPIESLPFYFRHPAFLPSFSLALLYFTVLSFSGQMITYLISVGYNSLHVGVARTVSTVFELSATWIAPRLTKRIGIVRGGIWSLCWQMVWLAGGMIWFFADASGKGTNSVVSATGLAVAVALSRIGLWGYDLCAQNIIQDVSDEPLQADSSMTLKHHVGSRIRVSRDVLNGRSIVPEPVRAALVCVHHYLFPAGSVPVARRYQCRRCVRCRLPVYGVCASPARAPLSYAVVHG